MLDKLTTDELKKIWEDYSWDDSTHKNLNLLNYVEHVFGEYWKRKTFIKKQPMSDDDINTILSQIKYIIEKTKS